MSVRDVLRSKEMEYLGFKGITVMLEDFEGNAGKKYNLPPHCGKYRGIASKKAEVIDLVNNVKTEFLATNDYINKLKSQLAEQQTLVFEKIGTINKLPEGCVVPETRDKAFEPFNYYTAIGYCKRMVESNIPIKKITPKQIPHVANCPCDISFVDGFSFFIPPFNTPSDLFSTKSLILYTFIYKYLKNR